MTGSALRYRRVLLKLSGEALMGAAGFGVDPGRLDRFAGELAQVAAAGVGLGLVVGGGNFLRGATLAGSGVDRVTGDQMGMLATVMNGLAMRDALRRRGCAARLYSAFGIESVCERYTRDQAVAALESGAVALFAGGTGNPFFTTDSAASLRAVEIGAEILFKATKVDGIYTADPLTDPSATRFDHLTYDEAVRRDLKVMDLTAILLCRDHGLPLRVFDAFAGGNLMRAVRGEDVGTLVDTGEGA